MGNRTYCLVSRHKRRMPYVKNKKQLSVEDQILISLAESKDIMAYSMKGINEVADALSASVKVIGRSGGVVYGKR